MKMKFLAVLMLCIIFTLSGCGGGGSSSTTTVTFAAQILSDPVFDGDIEQTAPTTFIITQGMSQTVQSVFAGIDPAAPTEFRAFLGFPLRGPDGVPSDAIIESATLDIVITSIQPSNGTIPIRIELVFIPRPTLLDLDFDLALQPALTFTTIVPPITFADVGNHVAVDVTLLMVEAQRLGLDNFRVRILEDFGFVNLGRIEINDTTGPSRIDLAPLLQVTYF